MPIQRAFHALIVSAVLAGAPFGLGGCSSAPVPPPPDADAGTGATAYCGEPPPPIYDAAPIGWAAANDLGLDGTTGGEGGEVVDVATTQDFILANEKVEPLVIQVSGTIGDGRRVKVSSQLLAQFVALLPGITKGNFWIDA